MFIRQLSLVYLIFTLVMMIMMIFMKDSSADQSQQSIFQLKGPYHHSLRTKLAELFFQNDQTTLDDFKVFNYFSEIKQRREMAFQIHKNYLTAKKNKKEEEAISDSLKKVQKYDLILKKIGEIVEKKYLPLSEYVDKLIFVLELEYALKFEGNHINLVEGYHYIKESLKSFRIKVLHGKENTADLHAVNLADPITGELLSVAELQNLLDQNYDLSKLEPVKGSGFTYGLPAKYSSISAVDVAENFYQNQGPLYKNTRMEWSPDNVVYYQDVRKTQSKPKIDVYFVNSKGKKEELKIKLGKEIHSDPSASALAATLGIYTDVTKYARDVKMYLGQSTLNDVKKEWSSYYKSYQIDQFIKETGRDEKGDYVVWIECLFENKLKNEKSIERIGPWAYGENGHQGLRETRGLMLFNIWVSNTDIKEAENNKLIIKSTQEGHDELYYLQHDMGFAFGNNLREKPLDFSWNAVKKIDDKSIEFNYRMFQKNSGFKHITFEDAKWMVRKIGQLSKKQMAMAIALGGWPNQSPYDLQSLLVEKLASRRNDLVQAFDLELELGLLPIDKSKDVKKVPKSIPGHTLDFRSEIREILNFPLVGAKNIMTDTIIRALSERQRVNIGQHELKLLGVDLNFVSQLNLQIDRSIVDNPEASGTLDQVIVRDDFSVGAQLGLGVVLEGVLQYVKKWSVIYPMPSQEEAKKRGPFLLDLDLPFEVYQNYLPANSIVLVEDTLEKGAEVELTAELFTILGSVVGPGVEGKISHINLGRVIINKKQSEKISVYIDQSKYYQAVFEAFFELGMIKVVPFEMGVSKGKMSRELYEVDLQDYYDNPELLHLFDDLTYHNYETILKHGKQLTVNSQFLERYLSLSFFGLFAKQSRFRLDDLSMTQDLSTGHNSPKKIHYFYDVLKENEGTWNVLGNKEIHVEKARLSSGYLKVADNAETLIDPKLTLEYAHSDSLVRTQELDNGYLRFINGLVGDNQFIPLIAKNHSVNRLWGQAEVSTTIELYESAFNRMMELSESEFDQGLVDLLHHSSQKLYQDKLNDCLTNLKNVSVLLNQIDCHQNEDVKLHFNEWQEMQKITSKKLDQLKNFGPSKSLMVNYLGRKYDLKSVVHRGKSLIKNLAEAKEKKNLNSKNNKEQLGQLVRSFVRAIKRSGHSYNPLVLAVMLNLVGEENYWMRSALWVPPDKENKWPTEIRPYNEKGVRQKSKFIDFQTLDQMMFDARDALEIYNNL